LWEYCCRAGTTTAFWWGNSISTGQANYNGNHTYGSGSKGEYRQQTLPVDSFEANPWGLYQVHGNVWEWCQDNWHPNYQGAPQDGSVWAGGDATYRVLRGGSWNNTPDNLRSSNRNNNQPTNRNNNVGFRLASTLIRRSRRDHGSAGCATGGMYAASPQGRRQAPPMSVQGRS
jgi:formylglycine-generating enzyme required for sulfatase activity